MTLLPGTRLGPYEITGAIGAGGMGEVFRARDTRLNRDVAIKVLPAAFADDPERLARFTREAQTLASLNHPNIAAIYGIEEVAAVSGSTGPGSRALVMELVEGKDLSAHIARGPIPIAQAVPIARQIVEALEAAHEQGIVHRDLKPANIKVREDGTVKVLDFGLAKATEGSSTINSALSHSPTISRHMTEAGMIMGTAPYMSPEQARGKPVDKRTDVWAFGCVLYEMLSGRRAFDGEDATEIISAIVKSEPELSALPNDVPAHLRTIVTRCLVKDRKTRIPDLSVVRFMLDGSLTMAASATAATGGSTARSRLPWALVAVLTIALIAGLLAWAPWRVAPVDDRQIRFTIATPDTLGGGSGLGASPVISPDGRLLVFPSPAAAGKPRVLWLRPIGALEAQPLPGTEGASLPFWSPDSRQVGFAASGKLKKIDVTGGPPQNLCDVATFYGGTWNREGVIVISDQGSLSRVSEAGGPLTEVVSRSDQTASLSPTFLPDGRHFIYSSYVKSALYVGSLDGGPPALVLDVKSMAAYAPPGLLLYQREGTLFAQAFDPKDLQVSGEPVRIADNVLFEAVGGRAAFSVSDTGVLVFRTGAAVDTVADLAWISRTGKAMGTVGDPAAYRQLRLSPDERRVVLERPESRTGSSDLFTLDFASRITSRLTFGDVGSVIDPVWLPDGRAVAFESWGKGKGDFYQQTLGTRDVTPVFESPEAAKFIDDWSPDGRFLLFHTLAPSKLYALPLSGDRKPVLLAQSQKTIDSPHFSPDSKWVSYNTDESGGWETWVASFPAFDNRRQVSSRGGGQARWRADGKELFYLALDGQMMSVAIVSDPKTRLLEFKTPTVLFQSPIARPSMTLDQYDVSRDGQRFIFLKPHMDPNAAAEPLAPITVVVNWQAGLTK